MEKATSLRFSNEEIKILVEAYRIIDELTDEANDIHEHIPYINWASERLLYHIGDYTVDGNDMEKCYDILQGLKEEKVITFSVKKD